MSSDLLSRNFLCAIYLKHTAFNMNHWLCYSYFVFNFFLQLDKTDCSSRRGHNTIGNLSLCIHFIFFHCFYAVGLFMLLLFLFRCLYCNFPSLFIIGRIAFCGDKFLYWLLCQVDKFRLIHTNISLFVSLLFLCSIYCNCLNSYYNNIKCIWFLQTIWIPKGN